MNIITLDFETYFDDDYTLSKMTTEAYVRDPRFEAYGVGVRDDNGTLVERPELGPNGYVRDPRFEAYGVGVRDDNGTLVERPELGPNGYVRDPRFEAYGVGVRDDNGTLIWIERPELGPNGLTGAFKWDDLTVLCHHAAFDGLILSHHFDIHPGKFLDTYSMAQFLFGPNQSKSLGALAERFGLPPKTMPYDKVKGRPWVSLDRETQREVADGCLHDVELTYTIFNRMMKGDY